MSDEKQPPVLLTESPLPIERIALLPSSHDGSQGTNRASPDALQIDARNDLEAVQCFLREYEMSPATWRAYRKESERLLLWAILDRGKTMSSLDNADFRAYIEFLKNPQPAERWCGPKVERLTAAWRPFAGPLSPRSVEAALFSINTMLTYLVDAGYLRYNPFSLIRQRTKLARKRGTHLAAQVPENPLKKVTRFLDKEMWAALAEEVENMPKEKDWQRNEYERARFLCLFLEQTGARVAEAVSHSMSSFRGIDDMWFWCVHGKGDKDGEVALPKACIEALERYRRHFGMTPLPCDGDTVEDATPILFSLRRLATGFTPISDRQVNSILKNLCRRAAKRLMERDPTRARKLLQVSAHWFRHTSVTHKLESGMAKRLVSLDARHADQTTTDLYTHDDLRERWKAAQSHDPRWGKKAEKRQRE